MSGFFNLNTSDPDGILSLNVESAEFSETNISSTNSEQGVNVPGGLKEQPNSKPYDETSKPGGEYPSAKPYDATSIPIPKGTTLTSEQYNKALDMLQRSFKEGAEMLDTLRQVTVVQETVEERHQRYVESVLDEALLEAYENGPIFEAVKKDDKEKVKSIVKSLRSRMPKLLKGTGLKYRPPKTFLRLLLNQTNPSSMSTSQPSANKVSDSLNWWTTRFWQVLGVVYCEDNNISELIDKVNTELADELDGYKVLYSPSVPGLIDIWNLKFGWKNVKNVYFLIVDKKLPAELKKLQSDMADAIKNTDGEDPK